MNDWEWGLNKEAEWPWPPSHFISRRSVRLRTTAVKVSSSHTFLYTRRRRRRRRNFPFPTAKNPDTHDAANS